MNPFSLKICKRIIKRNTQHVIIYAHALNHRMNPIQAALNACNSSLLLKGPNNFNFRKHLRSFPRSRPLTLVLIRRTTWLITRKYTSKMWSRPRSTGTMRTKLVISSTFSNKINAKLQNSITALMSARKKLTNLTDLYN